MICDLCSDPVFAVAPGSEPDTALDLFRVSAGEPMRCWCIRHWPFHSNQAFAPDACSRRAGAALDVSSLNSPPSSPAEISVADGGGTF